MAEMATSIANELLDHVLAVGSYTAPTSVEIGLSTTTVSADGTGITEPTWTGYAKQSVTFGAASSGAAANTGVVDFVHGGGATQTAVAAVLYDQAGNMLYFDNGMADTAVANGETLRFAIGDIDVTQA